MVISFLGWKLLGNGNRRDHSKFDNPFQGSENHLDHQLWSDDPSEFLNLGEDIQLRKALILSDCLCHTAFITGKKLPSSSKSSTIGGQQFLQTSSAPHHLKYNHKTPSPMKTSRGRQRGRTRFNPMPREAMRDYTKRSIGDFRDVTKKSFFHFSMLV